MPEIGEEPFNAFLGVPILHQGRVLGVLVVQQREPRRFDESEEAFLVTLSAQLATSVAHAEAVGSPIVADGAINLIDDGLFKGFAGAPGIGIGTGVVMHPGADLDAVPSRPAEDITVELMLLDRAIEAVRNDIRSLIQSLQTSLPQEELALLRLICICWMTPLSLAICVKWCGAENGRRVRCAKLFASTLAVSR